MESPEPLGNRPACEVCYMGLDPGLRCTGYALLRSSPQGPRLWEAGVIRSGSKQTLARRVYEIGSALREILCEFRPQSVAVEQVFSFGRNPKTALLMAHARGAILFAAAESNVPVIDYPPRRIKQMLTGSGRASKEQIQHAIKHELRLAQLPEPNDVADASAVALCLYHSLRFAA